MHFHLIVSVQTFIFTFSSHTACYFQNKYSFFKYAKVYFVLQCCLNQSKNRCTCMLLMSQPSSQTQTQVIKT